jgi:hypothetical protein
VVRAASFGLRSFGYLAGGPDPREDHLSLGAQTKIRLLSQGLGRQRQAFRLHLTLPPRKPLSQKIGMSVDGQARSTFQESRQSTGMIWMSVAESQCKDGLRSNPRHIQIVQEYSAASASVEKDSLTFHLNKESEAMLPPVGRVGQNGVIYQASEFHSPSSSVVGNSNT